MLFSNIRWLRLLSILIAPLSLFLSISVLAEDTATPSKGNQSLKPETEPHLLPMEAFHTMSPAEVVVNAYAKLERLTRASETKFSLQISGIEVWSADEFDQLIWGSIADFPEKGGISSGPTYSVHGDQQRSIAYQARWLQPNEYWFAMHPSQRRDPRTVQQAFEISAPHMPEVLEIDTLVTFEVAVDLEGRQEHYRAAMLLWHGSEGVDRMHPVDYFLQGLDQAIAERPALLTNELPQNVDSRAHVSDVLGAHWHGPHAREEKSSCIPFATEIERPMNSSGSNDHISGSHTVEASFKLGCSCDTACLSTCTAGFNWKQCVDTGTREGFFCHKLRFNDREIGANSLGGGTDCGAAYGCTQVTCTSPVCGLCSGVGLTISGGPNGFNMNLASGGAPDWSSLIEQNMNCPPCAEAPDGNSNTDPPQDGGDPSNGGAGNPPSPILINFIGDFRLTGLDDPVTFDIDADDFAETLGWSTREGDEAFLALDRNNNGWIDDGTELFGNFTKQPKSETPNGFSALEVFDGFAEGGNNDGHISADDAVFDSLLLWRDSDHDGVSDPEELFPLANSLVVSISLDYFESDLQDPHGNQLRYLSYVQFAGQPRPRVAAIDVFFVAEGDP